MQEIKDGQSYSLTFEGIEETSEVLTRAIFANQVCIIRPINFSPLPGTTHLSLVKLTGKTETDADGWKYYTAGAYAAEPAKIGKRESIVTAEKPASSPATRPTLANDDIIVVPAAVTSLGSVLRKDFGFDVVMKGADQGPIVMKARHGDPEFLTANWVLAESIDMGGMTLFCDSDFDPNTVIGFRVTGLSSNKRTVFVVPVYGQQSDLAAYYKTKIKSFAGRK